MPLHFCPECQNLITFGEKEGELQIQCRTCGYEAPSDETVLLTKTYKWDEGVRFGGLPAEIIYDPSLKRTIHYTCPNEKCETHQDADKKEAVFSRESESNLKQIIVCAVCHTTWH